MELSKSKKYFLALILMFFVVSVNASEFPGREIYPKVPYIELEDAYNQRDKIIFIDARSPYEYKTLRIKNSVLIPLTLSSSIFKKKMLEIRADYPDKKLVFYCNGHNCMKSYKAARRSLVYLGQGNVYAYDAGIFDWATKYPGETLLLEAELTDSTKLITKEKFNKHLMPAEQFIKKADENSHILDIRDRIERDGFYIFSGFETSISLNEKDKEKLDNFFKKVKKEKKTLYVYDMVGKQVRWFQYYIESKRIKDYYFMKGSAQEFFKIPIENLLD